MFALGKPGMTFRVNDLNFGQTSLLFTFLPSKALVSLHVSSELLDVWLGVPIQDSFMMKSMIIFIFQKSAKFLIWNLPAGYMNQFTPLKVLHNCYASFRPIMYNMS